MAEATPITEESTMQNFFSADFQLKTNDSFSFDEATQKTLHYAKKYFLHTDLNGNKFISLVSYIQQQGYPREEEADGNGLP